MRTQNTALQPSGDLMQNPAVIAALAQGRLAGWDTESVDNLLKKIIELLKK